MVRSIRWCSTVLIFLVASVAHASPASAVLFRGVKTSLEPRDQEAIARQVGLTLSKDKKSFVDEAGNTLMIVLSTQKKGYRDLQIAGPGFECPVWRWDGSQYDYSHRIKCQ